MKRLRALFMMRVCPGARAVPEENEDSPTV
jgi:hypothetical protein